MLIEGAALAAVVAAVFRPIQNVAIARMALHGAAPEDRPAIIEALAKTRQFGLWSKPRWPPAMRRSAAVSRSPVIDRVEPEPADKAR
ncbi:hypothetical protein Ato02nite_062510 [Paractinoplanes toevensis]|uniref:Uncharacterized protein n=1 Tax=Paractinoplanes toevensis TaxID=571911 RepID=A0A919W782_9ACTN|nr:hypothetical protein Ato02nite_062510 [Actinoplanes toevensis]